MAFEAAYILGATILRYLPRGRSKGIVDIRIEHRETAIRLLRKPLNP